MIQKLKQLSVIAGLLLLLVTSLGFVPSGITQAAVSGGCTPTPGLPLPSCADQCKLNQGTCATCYNEKGCIDCTKIACTDAAKDCNSAHCDLIDSYVNPTIALFSAIVGLVITISLIWGGIQYASSGGDPQKASAAKSRITKTLMAFFMYAFIWAFLQYLIPGGVFK